MSTSIMQEVVQVALTAGLDICSGKNKHKPAAQVLSHSMVREEGKKQRSTFKLNQAEGMS